MSFRQTDESPNDIRRMVSPVRDVLAFGSSGGGTISDRLVDLIAAAIARNHARGRMGIASSVIAFSSTITRLRKHSLHILATWKGLHFASGENERKRLPANYLLQSGAPWAQRASSR